MLDRIFPRQIDNAYQGHPHAIRIFILIVVMKAAISLGTIFNGRRAAQSADGVPLDSFDPAAVEAVVMLFAIWGLSQLTLSAIGIVALILYRAMIPLMYVIFLMEHLVRRVILIARPIARDGAPPGLWINLAILALMIAGLALSLRRREERPA